MSKHIDVNNTIRSISELKKKLEELKHKEFMLQMIDHWTQEDYRYDNELHQKIMKVKKEIEEVKNNGK